MKYELERACALLIEEIRSYESDTFSAEGSEITLDEAQSVAVKLINRIYGDDSSLDGILLSSILEDIRE